MIEVKYCGQHQSYEFTYLNTQVILYCQLGDWAHQHYIIYLFTNTIPDCQLRDWAHSIQKGEPDRTNTHSSVYLEKLVVILCTNIDSNNTSVLLSLLLLLNSSILSTNTFVCENSQKLIGNKISSTNNPLCSSKCQTLVSLPCGIFVLQIDSWTFCNLTEDKWTWKL